MPLAGALAGTLATVPMTLIMEVLYRRLPAEQRFPLPPREITMAVAARAGLRARLSEPARVGSSLLAHFAYGALTGALYPLLPQRLRRQPLACGAAYGVAVWALSYLGWVPATGILAPATRQPPPRRRLMITAHLVWGAATGWLSARLGER